MYILCRPGMYSSVFGIACKLLLKLLLHLCSIQMPNLVPKSVSLDAQREACPIACSYYYHNQ